MRAALRAEWTKLRTAPGAAIPLLLAAVVTALGVLLTRASPDPVQLSLTGIRIGQVAIVAAGVSIVAGEFDTGLIGITLLAVPRRTVLLASKAVLVAGGALVAAVIGVTVALLRLPVDGPLLRAAVGSIVYLILIGLLSVGVAAILRSAAVSIGVLLALLYLVPVLLPMFPGPHVQRFLMRATPALAAQSIATTVDVGDLVLRPLPALAMVAAWTAAALAAGAWLLHRRDA